MNNEQYFKHLYDNYKGKKAVVALSGGMDSTTLLYYCKKTLEMDLMAISFFYGQNHSKELELAKKVCDILEIPHQLINIDFLGEITKGVSSLTSGGDKIPEGRYDEANMKSTVVPFRNGIILSVLASYAEAHDCDVVVYGAHGGDHFVYSDCRPEFIESMKDSIFNGTTNNVQMIAPFYNITKSEIAKIGHELKVPYELTWSCYKGQERPCLKCMEENVDILMANYTTKKIKDLVPGDEIFSWGEKERTLIPSKVVEVHNNGVQLVKDYIMSNRTILPCTPEHKVGKKGNSTKYIMYAPIEKVNDADKNRLYYIDWHMFFQNNYSKALRRTYPEPKDFYLINLLRWENEREAQTYDITTTAGNYIANNLIVHNCGTCTERTLSFMENNLTDPSLTGEEWEEAVKISKELYHKNGEDN